MPKSFMKTVNELQSSLSESYATLFDYKKSQDPNRQLFFEDPCPVLIWQDWQDLEASKEYAEFSKTTKLDKGPQLFLPQRGIEALVVPIRKRPGSKVGGSKEISIGRSRKNDVYLNIPELSKHHAFIKKKGELYFVRDLNSTNGTWHRGSPIGQNPRQLEDTDYIGFAEDVVRFRYFSAEAFSQMLDD